MEANDGLLADVAPSRVLARGNRPFALVGPLLLTILSLGLTWNVLRSTHQYEVNDLVPVGSLHAMVSACASPYVFAGLGRLNPTPTVSLCYLGLIGRLLGPATAQHLYLVGALLVAGLMTFHLFRVLGWSASIATMAGVLYEFAPALMNQFNSGGPGLLVTAAVMPGVLAALVTTFQRNRISAILPAAGCIGLATAFDSQAPVLLAMIVIPSVAAFIRLPTVRPATAVKSIALLIAATGATALPSFLEAPGQLASVHRGLTPLLASVATNTAPVGGLTVASDFAWVPLLVALVGATILPFQKGCPPIVTAALYIMAGAVLAWAAMLAAGAPLVRLLPDLAVFQDFIKIRLIVSLPILLLDVYTISAVMRFGRRHETALAGTLIALLAGPVCLQSAEALTSLTLGLGPADRVPAVYTSALFRLHQVSGALELPRFLWLPQDIRSAHILSTLAPEALMYHQNSPPAANRAFLHTAHQIATAGLTSAAPDLGLLATRYVVVNRSYVPQAGAPWQSGAPNVAFVGGTYAIAGAERTYFQQLMRSRVFHPVSVTAEYAIFQNLDYVSGVRRLKDSLTLRGEQYGMTPGLAPVTEALTWVPHGPAHVYPGSSSVMVPGTASPDDWTEVSTFVPLVPRDVLRIQVQMTIHNVIASHIKIFWFSGPRLIDVTYVVPGQSGSRSVQIDKYEAPPVGATRAQVALEGGWADGINALTTFGHIRVSEQLSPAVVPHHMPSAAQLALQVLLPGEAVRPDTSGGAARKTQGSGCTLGSVTNCAILVGPGSMSWSGTCVARNVDDSSQLTQVECAPQGRIRVVLPSYVVPAAAELVWLEGQAGEAIGQYDVGHAYFSAVTPVTIGCPAGRCVFDDFILVPRRTGTASVWVLPWAYSSALTGESASAQLTPGPLGWNTEASGQASPDVLPAPAQVHVRWFGIAVAQLAMLGCFVYTLVADSVLMKWVRWWRQRP